MYTAPAAGGRIGHSQAKYPVQPPLETSPPASPTVSSRSMNSASSPSARSWEGRNRSRDDDVLSSSTLYSGTHDNLYHLQITKDGQADYHPPSEPASEQPYRISHETPERTLRRTSRSRRIESPVQLEEAAQTPKAPAVAAWDQHSSPQSHSNGVTDSPQRSYTQPSRPQGDNSPALSNEGSSKNETSAIRAPVPKRRVAYPLQAPASTTSLRDLPTPPPSPSKQRQAETTEKPSEAQAAPAALTNTKSKQLRRQNYPLQSPASINDLHHAHAASIPDPTNAQTQPPTQHTNTLDKRQSQVSRFEDARRNIEKMSLRRQPYPLQAPASTADLRATHTPPAAEDQKKPDTAAAPSASTNGVHADEKPFTRQKYPLQAPASTTDAPPTSMPPASAPPTLVIPEKSEHEVTEIPAQGDSLLNVDLPQWHRQTYPMQAASYRSPTPRPPTPGIDEKSGGNKQAPELLLPKNIAAVRDSEERSSMGRTIVVCLDGTGDQFDSDNSNIIHIVSALKKDDARQVTYYQAGIGTYGSGGLSSGFEAASDMAVGSGLGLHVRDAYQFLMHSYKEGDKICIFGFSRGAYTARCLAGMVHKVGLLPPRNLQQVYFAYKFYKDDSPEGWVNSADFKRTFSIDVSVYFLGCFDSVASVGIIPRQLPLSSTPTSKPRYFRHAMALDERRAKFKICRHQTKSWDEIDEEAVTHHEAHRARNHPNLTDEEYERIAGPGKAFDSDVLEVWFAGAHADVGGGAVKNVVRHKLAQIPLRWMIRQTFECDTGILFQTKVLAEHGLDVHTLWPKYAPLAEPVYGPPRSFLKRYDKELPPRALRQSKLRHSGRQQDDGEPLYHLDSPTDEDWTPEQVEDFYDAVTPMNDQLIQAPSWWILEAWPVQYKVPTTPGKCIVRTGMNWGQYRGVEDAKPKMHWTVKYRMQYAGYKVGVRTAKGARWQTVV